MNAQSGRVAEAQRMEQAIRDCFTACNADDAEAVAATCTPDAIHYFPVHMYGDDEPVRRGRAIGEKWARSVQSLGSRWSIDGPVLCHPGHQQAANEFTAERKNPEMIIRGSEWYRFDPGTGLIAEIRAYLASPPAPGFQRLELGGYPYAKRGYTAST
jgi:methyltransferase